MPAARRGRRRRCGRRPARARRPAPVDDQHAQHEQDAPADVRRAECVDQGLEHALDYSSLALRRREAGSGAVCAHSAGLVGSWSRGDERFGGGVGGGLSVRLGGRLCVRRFACGLRLGHLRVGSSGFRPGLGGLGSLGLGLGTASGSRRLAATQFRRWRLPTSPRARARRRQRGAGRSRRPLRSCVRALALNASAATNSLLADVALAQDLDRLVVAADQAGRWRAPPRLTVMTGWSDALPLGLGLGCPRPRRRSGRPRRTRRCWPTLTTWYSTLKRLLEAAQLGHADVDRRLAAFEPGRDRRAGARLLALGAAAGGLALAGGDAAADARPRLREPGGRASDHAASLGLPLPWTASSPSAPRRERGSERRGPCRASAGVSCDLDRVTDAVQTERAHGRASSLGCG